MRSEPSITNYFSTWIPLNIENADKNWSIQKGKEMKSSLTKTPAGKSKWSDSPYKAKQPYLYGHTANFSNQVSYFRLIPNCWLVCGADFLYCLISIHPHKQGQRKTRSGAGYMAKETAPSAWETPLVPSVAGGWDWKFAFGRKQTREFRRKKKKRKTVFFCCFRITKKDFVDRLKTVSDRL